jgi:hypothetical protein
MLDGSITIFYNVLPKASRRNGPIRFKEGWPTLPDAANPENFRALHTFFNDPPKAANIIIPHSAFRICSPPHAHP